MPKIAAGLRTPVLTFLTACAALFAFLAGSTASAPPARAAGVAFWGYWQAKDGTWSFATTGPAQAHPADGAVEGWRFARSSGSTGTPPRIRPDFAAICGAAGDGSGHARAGHKLVAVVIDYGEQADAPRGQQPPPTRRYCADVAKKASGTDVLAAVRPRADKSGLICAIDEFGPCAVRTTRTTARPSAPTAMPAGQKKGGSSGWYVGAGLIIVLAAGGAVAAARRRSRQDTR